MPRLQVTAAALLLTAIAASGCVRKNPAPTSLAPSRMTVIGVNGYDLEELSVSRRGHA